MAGSIDRVLQPDGTYKWEVVDPNAKAEKTTTTSKTTTKKVAKKKTTNPLSE